MDYNVLFLQAFKELGVVNKVFPFFVADLCGGICPGMNPLVTGVFHGESSLFAVERNSSATFLMHLAVLC